MSLDLFRVKEHVIASQHIREYPGATVDSQEEVLQLHIKQYIPLNPARSPSGSVTLIGAHANGFPKELYEPLWDEMHKRSKRQGFSIRSIWIADAAHQGMSSVLNEKKLGNDPSWMDHSRDLLNMINHFRDQMPRPLVGIGHSMGGTQLVNLALIHPRLLTTLVLLDPIIQNRTVKGPAAKQNIAYSSTFRRDLWPSRQAAAAAFSKSPFYQAWDKRVFDLWLEYGLRDLPTAVYPDLPTGKYDETPVTLTTTKHQEVWTFLRPSYNGNGAHGTGVMNRKTHPDADPSRTDNFPFYRPETVSTFYNLPFVRPSVLYIFGENSDMSSEAIMQSKLEQTGIGIGGSGGTKEGRVKDVLIKGVGHLIPMEAVDDSAEHAATWLGQELQRWREDEAEWKKVRESRDARENIVLSEEWIRHMGGPPKRAKATAITNL